MISPGIDIALVFLVFMSLLACGMAIPFAIGVPLYPGWSSRAEGYRVGQLRFDGQFCAYSRSPIHFDG